jgi:hypothetical protein
MSINRVILTGEASAPRLSYGETGKPECRLTVTLSEGGKDSSAVVRHGFNDISRLLAELKEFLNDEESSELEAEGEVPVLPARRP